MVLQRLCLTPNGVRQPAATTQQESLTSTAPKSASSLLNADSSSARKAGAQSTEGQPGAPPTAQAEAASGRESSSKSNVLDPAWIQGVRMQLQKLKAPAKAEEIWETELWKRMLLKMVDDVVLPARFRAAQNARGEGENGVAGRSPGGEEAARAGGGEGEKELKSKLEAMVEAQKAAKKKIKVRCLASSCTEGI